MSLYRGAGGASDATDDSTVNAVAGYASSAASSASAASTSASNASTSASAAATSASQAASSVSTAASHASNASTSASNASTSASSASSSASSASTSATNASNSAGSASTYASEALGYRNTASTHATNAANSASAAAGSATSASNSAASALAIYGNTVAMEAAVDDAQEAALTATQESQAASDSAIASAESEELAYEHEQNAAEWATVAQGAANSSVAAAGAANLAWDQFDDRYLGAKTVDPALDNDNNPLVTGALYFNSATGSMKVYTGTNWTDAYTTNNGFLLANNNLSDIQSDATARDNLGLGSIATQDYDTITITGGSITGITDLAINDGGTGASTAAGARSNLGLGSSAVLNAGVPGGVATLDGGGAVPTSQLPAAVLGAVKYQGVWNASSNSPAITSSTGTQGHYYVVFTAGSTSIDGISDWKVGDWIIYNGAVWQKIDNTDLVSSVNGYTGTINLAYSDVGAPSTSGTNATGTWDISVTGNAATVTNGVYTTGDQTIGGNKTFSNTISGSIDGNANTATSATSATTATNVSGGTASVTTLTTSSTVTLNGGTANGVAYLNGSKVLTTGSALTFDGTNLGIGTSSPGYKLDVASGDASAGQAIRIRANASAAAGGLQFTDSGATTQYGWIKGKTTGLSFYGGNNSAGDLFLDSSGNLGLGVTPSAWGGSYKAIQFSSGAIAGFSTTALDIYGNAYDSGAGAWKYLNSSQGATRYAAFNGQHQFFNAPSGTAGNAISFTQAMTLDASGNLGLVTTSPSVSDFSGGANGLHIKASVNYSILKLESVNSKITWLTAGDTATYLYVKDANPLIFGTNNTERARIDSSGNLLVGKTSALASSGNGCWFSNNGMISAVGSSSLGDTFNYYNSTAGAYRFYVNNAGTIFATSTTITSLSDVRHKENIRDLDDGLAAIMSLQPRKFDWKEGKGANIKNARGFIAQEFEQVFPDLIDEWKDPAPEGEEPYKSVRADLIPVLVKAIQEQQSIIDAQQAALEQLKAQLTSVSADVAALKGN